MGTASSVSATRAESALYTTTYEHLFPVVIALAVSELACGVVYRDLLFQLVRWFSGHNQVCAVYVLLGIWYCCDEQIPMSVAVVQCKMYLHTAVVLCDLKLS